MCLVVYTIMTRLEIPFPFIFLAFMITTCLFLYMVIRILKDPYSTQKTFTDWYEDKEIER